MVNSFRFWIQLSREKYVEEKFWLKTVSVKPEITCSKSTLETLEQGVKYVQS